MCALTEDTEHFIEEAAGMISASRSNGVLTGHELLTLVDVLHSHFEDTAQGQNAGGAGW